MQEYRYRTRDRAEKRPGRAGSAQEELRKQGRRRLNGRRDSQRGLSEKEGDPAVWQDSPGQTEDLPAGSGRKRDYGLSFQEKPKTDGRFREKPGMGRLSGRGRETDVVSPPRGKDGRRRQQRQYLQLQEKTKGARIQQEGWNRFAGQMQENPQKETGETGKEAETEDFREDLHTDTPEPRLQEETIRSRPSAAAGYAEAAAGYGHVRRKKQVQEYARKERERQEAGKERKAGEKREENRYRRTQEAAGESLEEFRDEIGRKSKRERLNQEQRKKTARLSFGDEGKGMVRGPGMKLMKEAGSAAAGSALIYAHGKGNEAGKDNSAVDAVHKTERITENALRRALHEQGRGLRGKESRLREAPEETAGREKVRFRTAAREAEKTAGRKAAQETRRKENAVKRFWQKQRYKRAYLAAREGRQEAKEAVRVSESVIGKVKRVALETAARNKGIFGAAAVMTVLFALMAVSLSSCGALMQGTTSSIAGTTYPSTDEDIYAVEDAYTALEDALNDQINAMEASHPGHDEYRYQVDEISHNPYHLISYFTAKYGEFTYEQVKDEIVEIFREQYGLSADNSSGTVTETKTVRVGESLGQVATSGYCSCPICCGVWSGGPTASGVYPTAAHTLAVDASHPFVPMGTKVIMNGVEYVVEDTGAFAQYGVQFDVYYDDHAEAAAHGHQVWEAYLADDSGTQEVEVTSTRRVDRLDVTLANRGLDAVLESRMDENEKKRYDLYNTTYGHRDYLFDLNALPGGGTGGFGYQVPAEALSDQKFANMIQEAEKYLGYPYVWGGSSPSTSFDCSGFVSWVVNNCGNGWNVGRCTADGLRGHCAYVSPEQAKPGDLIFFQGTYNTTGASHVGIYVGNNMMIHCGNPIQYASIASSYWQQHFMAFGRIQ